MAKNKTCPFCGSDSIEVYTHYGESAGIQYGGYYPECTVCGCRLGYYETREEALKAWNEREENKMPEVARLFGKELGEEFRIKDLIDKNIYIAVFDNYGMRAYIEGMPSSWRPRRDMVMRLIVGEAVIINENEAEC